MKSFFVLWFVLDGTEHCRWFYKSSLLEAQNALDSDYQNRVDYQRLDRHKEISASQVQGQRVANTEPDYQIPEVGGAPVCSLDLIAKKGRDLQSILSAVEFSQLVADCRENPTNPLAVELHRAGLLRS